MEVTIVAPVTDDSVPNNASKSKIKQILSPRKAHGNRIIKEEKLNESKLTQPSKPK
jgi:hypothetical protein